MKRSLRQLSKKRLSAAETRTLLVRFKDMDDRTCAIILGAMLDHSLERLLLRYMRRLSNDARERLFYGTGPLGSFSAKVQIASAFGIIGPKTAHDFRVLNEIRNAFGHASHEITFQNASVRAALRRLNALPAVEILLGAFKTWSAQHFNSARGRFLLIAFTYVNLIDDARKGQRPKQMKLAVQALDGR